MISIIAPAQQLEIYYKIAPNQYESLVHNEETNTMDTLNLTFTPNHTFIIRRTGTWDDIILAGEWKQRCRNIIMTNRYPYHKPLSVKVVPNIDSCNEFLPDLVDGTGRVRYDFHLNMGRYTYSSDMKITYTELDNYRDSVYICSSYGYYCSENFSIPFKECYRIIIEMEFNPERYNGAIRKLHFRKQGSQLKLLK